MKDYRKKPCKDCPFKKTSLAGWLGNQKPENIISYLEQDHEFPCHNTIPKGSNLVSAEEAKNSETMQHCAGALIMHKKSCKRSRDSKVAQWQSDIKSDDDVFSHKSQFLDHHKKLDK